MCFVFVELVKYFTCVCVCVCVETMGIETVLDELREAAATVNTRLIAMQGYIRDCKGTKLVLKPIGALPTKIDALLADANVHAHAHVLADANVLASKVYGEFKELWSEVVRHTAAMRETERQLSEMCLRVREASGVRDSAQLEDYIRDRSYSKTTAHPNDTFFRMTREECFAAARRVKRELIVAKCTGYTTTEDNTHFFVVIKNTANPDTEVGQVVFHFKNHSFNDDTTEVSFEYTHNPDFNKMIGNKKATFEKHEL